MRKAQTMQMCCSASHTRHVCNTLVWLQVAVMHGLVEDLAKQVLTLEDVLHMHLPEGAMLECATAAHPLSELIAALDSYTEEHTFEEGETVFDVGDPGEAIYIVLSGSFVSMMDFFRFDECALKVSVRQCLPAYMCERMA